jgi:outer membrane translocation and assembly module TamA
MTRSRSADQPLIAREDPTTDPDQVSGLPHPDDRSASGNLDKIRDILFGAQAREHDRRFAQLEQHLIREASDLRNDLKRRFESLELYIKKEVDALTSRLTKEQEVRGESVTNLTQDLTQLAATLEDKARLLDMQTTQAQAHILQQLTERTSELATDVRARHAEATSALNQAVHDLRAEKTDRTTLAAILLEASQRLSSDEAVSGRG